MNTKRKLRSTSATFPEFQIEDGIGQAIPGQTAEAIKENR
jgi:hypothetical protein